LYRPDLDYAARFTVWAARQPTWKQRIQAQYRHWVAGNPNYGANDVSNKPADDVVMAGDLPYPPRNPGNTHKTFSPDPWKDVRGTTTPPPSERLGSILMEAHNLVHGPRQDAYGHPANDFSRTAALANVLLAGKLRADLDARDVALFMVAVKLSRQVNKHGRDNLVDAAGYLETLRMVEGFLSPLSAADAASEV